MKKAHLYLLACFTPIIWGKTLSEIQNDGVIRIGVFGKTPLIGFVDENGKNQGFDIEVARELAGGIFAQSGRTEGNKIEFKTLKVSERIGALKTDEVDLVLANFSVNPQRKKEINFSVPYMKVSAGVVSPKEKAVKDLKNMAKNKETMIVIKGSTSAEYLRKNFSNIQTVFKESGADGFEALKKGQGHAMIQDNLALLAWLMDESNFELSIPSIAGTEEMIAVGIDKGNTELLKAVNQELNAMKKDGRLEAIYNQTLKPSFGNKINPKDILVLD